LSVDLVYGTTVSQVTHDSKIDWLELNETGHKLLFRDKKMRLMLVDVLRDQKSSILNFCTFVQASCSDIKLFLGQDHLIKTFSVSSAKTLYAFYTYS
jgi:intraflagellar transport protein 172